MLRMRNHSLPPTTPLLTLLRQLGTPERRDEFAKLAGTSTAYLYQLAGCNRAACRARLALALAVASEQMAAKYGVDPISMQTLASMCPVQLSGTVRTRLEKERLV